MSYNEKPINKIFENYLNILSDYLTIDINSNKIPYNEKIIHLYISKKKLEEDYLNGNNFNDLDSVKNFINKFTFSFFYSEFIRYKFYTLNEFFDLIERINKNNNDENILEEINEKKKICNDYYQIIKVIIYINQKFNEYNNTIYDKGILPKIIWIYFYIIKKNLIIENKIEYSKYGKIICILFEYFLINEQKFYNRNYYYSIYKDQLFKQGIKFDNYDNENYEIDILNEIKNINFTKDYIKDIKEKKIQFDKEIKIEEINFIDIYDSFVIEDFEETNLLIKKKNFNSSLPLKNINKSLNEYINNLNRYEVLDIDIIFHRYNPKLFEENKLIYHNVIDDFDNYYEPIKNKNKISFDFNKNNSIKKKQIEYSLQKQFFLHFLYILINNQKVISSIKFIENLQCLTYYSYLTLQYIEDKQFLINSTFTYINFLKSYLNFSILTSYQINHGFHISELQLPFHINNIVKKYFDLILSIILFSENSEIFNNPKDYNLLSQSFYQYSFNIIDKIGNIINFNLEIRENVFLSFIKIVNYNNGILIKGKFIDQIILWLFSIQINQIFKNSDNEKNIINEYNKIREIYIKEKQKSSIPDLYEIFLYDENKNKNINLKDLCEIQLNKEIKNQNFFPCNLNYKTLFLTSTNEFNTLLQNTNNKEENIYSGKKRIRALTPTINEKKIISSPFKSKICYSGSNTLSAISAFKTLNFQPGNNSNSES